MKSYYITFSWSGNVSAVHFFLFSFFQRCIQVCSKLWPDELFNFYFNSCEPASLFNSTITWHFFKATGLLFDITLDMLSPAFIARSFNRINKTSIKHEELQRRLNKKKPKKKKNNFQNLFKLKLSGFGNFPSWVVPDEDNCWVTGYSHALARVEKRGRAVTTLLRDSRDFPYEFSLRVGKFFQTSDNHNDSFDVRRKMRVLNMQISPAYDQAFKKYVHRSNLSPDNWKKKNVDSFGPRS